jgi:primase-polymerase (primpol)-like protein
MTQHARANGDGIDQVPTYLKNARRWLLWRRQQKPGDKKPRKLPYYVSGKPRSKPDSPEDLGQLVTYSEAKAILDKNLVTYAGLGFALGIDDLGGHWQGVDIDSISLHPELQSEIDQLPGYVEKSPSGDGVHAIGHGGRFTPMGSDGSGIEAYSHGRFFTFTGNTIRCGPLTESPHRGCKRPILGLRLRDR